MSAYALIVEEGTRLAARIRRGELLMPDDDVAADRYLLADAALTEAGLQWYEVSNWARPGGQCRHNLAYWRGDDWWGVGPGGALARRWRALVERASTRRRTPTGWLPARARRRRASCSTPHDRRVEDVLLRLRLAEGLPLSSLHPAGAAAAGRARDDGLLDGAAYDAGRAVLTLRGRLLADAVVRDLVD